MEQSIKQSLKRYSEEIRNLTRRYFNLVSSLDKDDDETERLLKACDELDAARNRIENVIHGRR